MNGYPWRRLWCYLRGSHSWEWFAQDSIADVRCWRCGYTYGHPPRE